MLEETRLRKLIESAILNINIYAIHVEKGPNPLWSYVGDLFDLPSAEAIQLCHEFGHDRHEEIGDPEPPYEGEEKTKENED